MTGMIIPSMITEKGMVKSIIDGRIYEEEK